MDVALLDACLVFACVFDVAGIGKQANLFGSRDSAGEFGVHERFIQAFALVAVSGRTGCRVPSGSASRFTPLVASGVT